MIALMCEVDRKIHELRMALHTLQQQSPEGCDLDERCQKLLNVLYADDPNKLTKGEGTAWMFAKNFCNVSTNLQPRTLSVDSAGAEGQTNPGQTVWPNPLRPPGTSGRDSGGVSAGA